MGPNVENEWVWLYETTHLDPRHAEDELIAALLAAHALHQPHAWDRILPLLIGLDLDPRFAPCPVEAWSVGGGDFTRLGRGAQGDGERVGAGGRVAEAVLAHQRKVLHHRAVRPEARKRAGCEA